RASAGPGHRADDAPGLTPDPWRRNAAPSGTPCEREDNVDFSLIFLPEVLGTAMLTLLGCGVVANAILPKTKGNGGGWLLINFGWGLAVFAGVYVAYSTGAHINPA